jgi:hypothetical protein
MKKILLILLLISYSFALCSISVVGSAHAQSASEGATQLRDSVKQQVADELAQIKKAVSKKAFLGSITGKSEATLTISNYLGQNRSAVVSTDTAIKLVNGADGTPADLKTGNYILVMGDVDSAGNMTAKRLLVIATPVTDKRNTAYGKVTAVGTTITIDKLTARLASDSYITTTAGGKTVKIKSSDIKVGSIVTLITKTGTTSPLVTDLYVFPFPASSSAIPIP